MTKIDISICPTSLEYNNGETYDAGKLLDALRKFILDAHPDARIACLQIGHNQGDEWAAVDGDDDAGADLVAAFFAAHGADENLFVGVDNQADSVTLRQIAALQSEASTAGDDAMADLCERAMVGDPIALRAVADAIANAAAQDDQD